MIRGYSVGRATSPDGPFYWIGTTSNTVDSFIDTKAQNGQVYYYVVTAYYAQYYRSSDYSNIASAVATDDLTPHQVPALQGVYDPTLKLIKITWSQASDPDIAGYWVCPEYPGGTRYRLAHSSPVTHTIYYWPVPEPLPDSAVIAVASMDYSGHISDWKTLTVPIALTIALTNNPSASGLNNAGKLVYDPIHRMLHTVYSDNNSVIYKNSSTEGTTWANELNLGNGFYPALTKDNENELHCAWVDLLPTRIPPDPTQPHIFYVPLPEYTWFLKYRYTENGAWQGESASVLDDFRKSPAIPMSMHFSSPSITTTQDSVHIFMEKTIYYYYPPGWHCLLCYYAFPKDHPEMLSSSVIDSAFEYAPSPPLPSPESLVNISDPSCASDKYNGVHIAYAIKSEIRYQYKNGENWSGPQTISCIGINDQPCIGTNGDEITVVWSGNPIPDPGSQILCRRKFLLSAVWGNIERLDTGTNLSVYPVCLNNQVLWSEQIDSINYEIYYVRLNGYEWTGPENLSKTLRRSILPQATYYGGTLYYLFTEGNSPYWLLCGRKTIPEGVPIYAIRLGAEEPSSATLERDGFLVYGEEPYKTMDYDRTQLKYSLTGFDPDTKYVITWDWYHESQGNWKERLRIDNIFNEHKWVPSGERVTIRKPIPQAVVQDGVMEITDEITAGNGFAVLSGFAIYEATEGCGGPQGGEAQMSMPFFLEQIYPNPAKGLLRIRIYSPDEYPFSVKLYDVCGRLMHQENIKASKIGMNEVLMKPEGLSAGVYFVTMETQWYKKTEKVILLR